MIEKKKNEKSEEKSLSKKSIIENILLKNGAMRLREVKEHKNNSIKLSIFIGLFLWLIIGIIIKNIILSAGVGILLSLIILIILLQIPLAKRNKYNKQVEADLPLFLMRLTTELRIGKNYSKAIMDSCKEGGFASKEFMKVLLDMKKGASFSQALQEMNERMNSLTIRRVTSNLSNLSLQGTKDVSGLKKVAQELLLKQRIESKEFSGRMVVYALVFIAISAIVPAMFQSFTLIGSYFMKINFTATQVFLISVILFPALDLAVLLMINSKTPIFLRQ